MASTDFLLHLSKDSLSSLPQQAKALALHSSTQDKFPALPSEPPLPPCPSPQQGLKENSPFRPCQPSSAFQQQTDKKPSSSEKQSFVSGLLYQLLCTALQPDPGLPATNTFQNQLQRRATSTGCHHSQAQATNTSTPKLMVSRNSWGQSPGKKG